MSVPEPFKPRGWYHEDDHEIIIALSTPRYVLYEFQPFFKKEAEYVRPTTEEGTRDHYTLEVVPTTTAFVFHKDQPSFAQRGRTPKYNPYRHPSRNVRDARYVDKAAHRHGYSEDPEEMLFYDLTEDNSKWFNEKVIIRITL